MPGDSAAPKGLAVSEVVAEEDEVTLRSGERLSPHCSHIQGDFLTHSNWPWSVPKKIPISGRLSHIRQEVVRDID